MARVFISYASEDHECADQLHRWLVAEGHEAFLDHNPRDGIVVGEEWDKRLHERLYGYGISMISVIPTC
jgi:TIR domain